MDQELLHKVLACPRLPSLPTVAIEVIELARQQDINLKQIARTISNDPGLATKILRTVNSSFYGLPKPVSTITHAIVILGLNSVKTLALGFSLVGNFKNQSEEEADAFQLWRRSLYGAVAGRSFAQHLNMVESEEVFLGGLLQDLGAMTMQLTIGQPYIHLLSEAGDDHRLLTALEQAKMDLGHAQVGAALAEHWQLPPLFKQSIEHHEHPENASEAVRPIVQLVSLGGWAADVLLRDDPAEPLAELIRLADLWFGVDRETVERLLVVMEKDTREVARLFDITPAASRDVGQILADANETLLQLSLETQMNASQLERRNRQLQEQVSRDSLTGVANRGKFNEFIRQQFEQSREEGDPLSVIFIDADRFKAVNDTHGHMAGDQVLISLAQCLSEQTPSPGLVGRYGGEEFAIVLPGADRREAAQLAERIRAAVEAMPIEAGCDLVLRITVSVGVATFDGSRFFEQPEQLVKTADQAVYAAKASGRNCVRVFAPKVRQPAMT